MYMNCYSVQMYVTNKFDLPNVHCTMSHNRVVRTCICTVFSVDLASEIPNIDVLHNYYAVHLTIDFQLMSQTLRLSLQPSTVTRWTTVWMS